MVSVGGFGVATCTYSRLRGMKAVRYWLGRRQANSKAPIWNGVHRSWGARAGRRRVGPLPLQALAIKAVPEVFSSRNTSSFGIFLWGGRSGDPWNPFRFHHYPHTSRLIQSRQFSPETSSQSPTPLPQMRPPLFYEMIECERN